MVNIPAPKGDAVLQPQVVEGSAPQNVDPNFLKKADVAAQKDASPAFQARFSAVYKNWKESERRIAELEAENKRLSTPPADNGRGTAVDLDLEIARLGASFAQAAEDPRQQFETLTKLADIKAEQKIRKLEDSRRAATAEEHFAIAREGYRAEALKQFGITPETPQAELVNRAAEIYNSDPWLQTSPRGEFDAMQQAVSEVQAQALRSGEAVQHQVRESAQLGGPSRRTVDSGVSNRAKEFAEAFATHNPNRAADMAAYMAKYSPWSKPIRK